MKDIDWSKAPEWATLYLQHISDSRATAWAESYEHGARVITPERNEMFGLIPQCWLVVCRRPTSQWNGEGLPPVGTVCEVEWFSEWIQCEIIAHFNQPKAKVAAFTMLRPHGGRELSSRIAECFRPIHTPEQTAAEKRDAGIEALFTAGNERGVPAAYSDWAWMYDHGCRMTAEDER